MSTYTTVPIESPEYIDDSPKPDESKRTISLDEDDPLLLDSPKIDNSIGVSSNHDGEENTIVDVDLSRENGSSITMATHDDHKDNVGEDFDIIGGFEDQHFEVLDSAGEVEGDSSNGTANSKAMDTSGSVSPKDKNKLDTDQMECSVGEEKDEIHISTSEDISDDRNDGSARSISPVRFAKDSAKKKSDGGSSSSKGASGAHRISDRLFHNTRYFVMKSNNFENIDIAKSRNVWSTLPYNEKKLNKAYRDCRNVLLIYSVKESGSFQGFAKLVSESRTDTQKVPWVLPPTISASQLNSVFKLDWIHKGNLDFNLTMDLKNPWNESKPVKISRDGQEIEPSIGEGLCRLWSTVTEDSSDAPREKRKGMTHSRKDGGIPSYPHHHMTPMIPPHYPPMPIFHDGRHPHQIHLNPALYPMPSKHHLSEAEELLRSKRRKNDRESSHGSKSDRVIRRRSRSPIHDHRDREGSYRHRGETSSSSRRRRSRSRSHERSRHRGGEEERGRDRERPRRSGGQSSSSSGGGTSSSTFEKNYGVSKQTLLHGSYADYIKEYTARSSRSSQPSMNISQIASQYQKALSQVASALASQTATQQQPLDPQTYNKKVEEFLERTKQKS